MRKGLAKENATIEIDVQADYSLMGLEDYVASPSQLGDGISAREENIHDSKPTSDVAVSSSRGAPEIDSEILYEGITSAPPQEKSRALHARVKGAVKTASKDGNSVTLNAKPAKGKSLTLGAKKKRSSTKKHRSSTMPGFAKDDSLDLHVASLDVKRLPPSAERSRTARMVRSGPARLRRRRANSESMYRRAASVPDSFMEYAQEIHAISRVTPKEEKELGTKTQEAIRLQTLHGDLEKKYGREPSDKEWCAAAGKVNMLALEEAIEDGMRAKNQLVASNLRMVQRVVNLYIRNGLGSEYNAGDLMQDGTVALIRAAEKYEPDRGFRFSTYAMYWIRSAVKRSQTSQSRIVSVPQRVHETHKRTTKVESELREELGRKASDDEVAAACDISLLQLDRCRKAMGQATFSLDAELENSFKPNSDSRRKDTMYDIVAGRIDETEYERTQRLLMKEHLIGTLRRFLSPHEADLLLLRYGLMDDRALPGGMSGPLTIAEVSGLVGLKPDKVRRIIINSQKQLRHLMKEWEDFEYELA